MSDRVWVRAHVEQMSETTDYFPVNRGWWESLTDEQRDRELSDFALQAMNDAGGCGASVVDEAEVPAEWLGMEP